MKYEEHKAKFKVQITEEKKNTLPQPMMADKHMPIALKVGKQEALEQYLKAEGTAIAKKYMLRAETTTAAFSEGQRPHYHQQLDRFIEHTNLNYFDDVTEIQSLRMRGNANKNRKFALTPQPIICLFLQDNRTGKEFCLLGTSGQPAVKGQSVASHTVNLLKKVADDLNVEYPGTYHVWDLPEAKKSSSVDISVEIDFGKQLRDLCSHSSKLQSLVPWKYPAICGEPTAFIILPCLMSQYDINFRGMAIYRLYDYRRVASIPDSERSEDQKAIMMAYNNGKQEVEIRETAWGEQFCLRSMCMSCRSQREAWGQHQAYARGQLRDHIEPSPYLKAVAKAYLSLVPTVVEMLNPLYPSKIYTENRLEFMHYIADQKSKKTKKGFDTLYQKLFKDFGTYEDFLCIRAHNGYTIFEDLLKFGRYETLFAFAAHWLDLCTKQNNLDHYLKIIFPFYLGDERGWLVADRVFYNQRHVMLDNYLELMWYWANPKNSQFRLSLRAYKYFFSSSGPHRHRLLNRVMKVGSLEQVQSIFKQLDLLYEEKILTEQEYAEILFLPDKHHNQSITLLDALGSRDKGIAQFFFKKINALIAANSNMEKYYLKELQHLPSKYRSRIELLMSISNNCFKDNCDLFYSQLQTLKEIKKITPATEQQIKKMINSVIAEKSKVSMFAPSLRKEGLFKQNSGYPPRDERTTHTIQEYEKKWQRALQKESYQLFSYFNLEAYQSWIQDHQHDPVTGDFVPRTHPKTALERVEALIHRIECAFEQGLILEEQRNLWMDVIKKSLKKEEKAITTQTALSKITEKYIAIFEHKFELLEEYQLEINFGRASSYAMSNR